MTSEKDKPKSAIEKRINELVHEMHVEGHTRRDIVHNLRKVADRYEDFWADRDSWNLSPSEKNVVLLGDHDDE